MLFASQLVSLGKNYFSQIYQPDTMSQKKKSSRDKQSDAPTKKHKNENPDKKHPNPDNTYKAKYLPIKEMSVTGGPHHPHNEEILDGIPK